MSTISRDVSSIVQSMNGHRTRPELSELSERAFCQIRLIAISRRAGLNRARNQCHAGKLTMVLRSIIDRFRCGRSSEAPSSCRTASVKLVQGKVSNSCKKSIWHNNCGSLKKTKVKRREASILLSKPDGVYIHMLHSWQIYSVVDIKADELGTTRFQ